MINHICALLIPVIVIATVKQISKYARPHSRVLIVSSKSLLPVKLVPVKTIHWNWNEFKISNVAEYGSS